MYFFQNHVACSQNTSVEYLGQIEYSEDSQNCIYSLDLCLAPEL